MPRLKDWRRSKSHRVAGTLEDWIAEGRFTRGKPLPSEVQLMEALQVSRGTVRRGMRQLIDKGLVEPRPGIGHVLRSATPSRTVGVMFGMARLQAFHSLTYEALLAEARARGLALRTYMGQETEDEHHFEGTQLQEDLRDRRLHGLITFSWRGSGRDRHLARQFHGMKLPLVQFSGGDLPTAMGNDLGEMTAQAAALFAGQGRQRIGLAVIGYEKKTDPGYFQGYARALIEAGLTVDPQLVWHLTDRASERRGYLAFRELWQRPTQPDALIVTDDIMARGLLAGAVDHGVAVPEVLRFACLDVKGTDTYYLRPVVRMQVDPAALARAALDRLDRYWSEADFAPDRRHTLHTTLIDERGKSYSPDSTARETAP